MDQTPEGRAAAEAAKAARRVQRFGKLQVGLWSLPLVLFGVAMLLVCFGCGWALLTS